jgi:hypothetical protein
MSLRPPNLDDRNWDQLMQDAMARIRVTSPEWTDLTPGDPGTTLVEVFAYLTETLMYRLNRVPEKLFIEFLRLIGIRLEPQTAAATTLVFRRKDAKGTIDIPRGTRVTVGKPISGREPPVFVTADAARIPEGADEVRVKAFNVELVEAETAGPTTGRPGYRFTVRRPPIVLTGGTIDLVVAVEAMDGELKDGDPAIEYDGQTYRVWREAQYFTDQNGDPYVYVVDRGTGQITFAPEARMRDPLGSLEETARPIAEVPEAGRRILTWYPRGGGSDGNVDAETLTLVKDPISGVEVTNPEPATGGHTAETLENALVRGPQEFHALNRAVTARDFELVALRPKAIARAIAHTQEEIWEYATPGTVEMHLVPALAEGTDASGVTADQLTALHTSTALETVQAALDKRRPLGTHCIVDWTHYKTVRVKAEIVVHRQEDAGEVRRRVDGRLHQTVNPLSTELNATGWPFGGTLYASSAYKIILSEPGVRYARNVKLMVDATPQRNVGALAVDPFQPRTWYAGTDDTLFRSLNDGLGWEAMQRFDGERIVRIRPHPKRPGLVALATRIGQKGSRVYVSWDCGATWSTSGPLGMNVADLGWIERAGVPKLLIGTDNGLYERLTDPGADLEQQTLVDKTNQGLGILSIAVSSEVRGEVSVAVATDGLAGVWLSSDAGQSGTFRRIGLNGKDIVTLAIQRDGPNQYLWAGVRSIGDTPGEGCHRWQLLGREDPHDGWVLWNAGWQGGSCLDIAFLDSKQTGKTDEIREVVLAATWRAGVLRLDPSQAQAVWRQSEVNSGLVRRDNVNLAIVTSVVADPARDIAMAGGDWGIRRSIDRGSLYDDPAQPEFEHEVTIPPTWVLVNGQNDIRVTSDA